MNSHVQNNDKPIRTRFAPSPTGFLHIGGARTALFNWLFARHHGGTFYLRIEDTDRARSTQAAIDAILEGLTWLGLDWDGDVVSQFERAPRHVEVVDELLAAGKAFKCYCTTEEVQVLRDQAFAEGRALRSPWRDRPASEAPAGTPFVVRFRAPDSDVVLDDAVQGTVRWAAKEFDDLILLRSDGSPTYNLAVVVDDHDMGITHIVRGDDHLVNGGRQSQIYDALGWDRPVFAHVPLIHGQDGKKLSKRHGALGAEAYRDMGYLPEGLRNYLLRLGWAHGDQEIFSDEEAIAAFTLDGLNKAPARMDLDKLNHINGHHMARAADVRLVELVMPFLDVLEDRIADTQITRERLLAAMPVLKTRAATLEELARQSYFLLRPRPFRLEGKAAKPLDDEARQRLYRLFTRLSDLDGWTDEALAAELKNFAEAEEVGFGKVGQPLRAALTGGAPAPDLSLVMAFLGRGEALDRIKDQMMADA
ncbi:MAG: glutamate--tRNA ligase [Oceanicaulis sp.]|uniref:Glutamate--tRNA ligase n=1 Tax=Maricaulis virginensis TaxID=144022 RepID=A0A9W6MNQ4_9PROT|nr:glutamate--tRNA ligase [Oceanicaulis sp.]MAZ92381.1 glutamate--tRNA ligase [Maricaulis sp.]MBI75289.1 glutamate--tRNA ligase [Oceanicaulis sp.]GLK52348.1 glutamate--tRNA ligase [Maricaulis virginensis]